MALVVHPASAALLETVTARLPQALLLGGDNGIGLSTIARSIAGEHTPHPIIILPEKDDKIDLEKGSIGVEQVRRLYDQTRSKQKTKAIFVIDYADRMTRQAQNAFLKLLEEPNSSTYFILVAHQPDLLLPTVRSRTQYVPVNHATTAQSDAYLDSLGVTDATKRTQLLYMADGRPAELHRLLHDDDYFARRAHMIRDARTLLQGSPYERLLIAHTYREARADSLVLLNDAVGIARHTISQNPQAEIITRLEALMTAYDKINRNGNIRLVLASLML